MAQRFIAQPTGAQDIQTRRQFQQLQIYLERLEQRIAPAGAVLTSPNMVLQDTAWQEIVPDQGYGTLEPATYSIQVISLAIGTNNNAEAQFRLNDGSTTIEGDIRSVGNNTVTIVGSLYVPEGASFVIEARGISCTLTDINIVFTKIGSSE